MKILPVIYSHAVRSRFEALGVLRSKSWRKQTLFFWKKWGSVFFNFFIRALLRPQIVIQRRTTILCVWKYIFWKSQNIRSWMHFSHILILRGQNNENITRDIFARRWIAIWDLRSARIKKLKKTDPHFFPKKIRVCFL